MNRATPRRPGGFTLIELSIVLLIIGILVAFILSAGAEGVARAQVRATQALVMKLEVGINERMDALLTSSIPVTQTHRFLAATYPPPPGAGLPPPILPWGLRSEQRASVIATFDYIKAELPDVFYVFDTTGNVTSYPLNFAGQAYPGPLVPAAAGHPEAPYLLPLGAASTLYFPNPNWDGVSPPTNLGPGDAFTTLPVPTGVYGASYSAAGGIYKNLGYVPAGYDGVDNDLPGSPGYGYIDEFNEGTGGDPVLAAQIIQRLKNHKHATARSEMLYAILVEGRGPYGSVFTRDDFTSREVQDTDGDGLPEFVDAWGQPLQFYRWPIHYIANTTLSGSSWPLTYIAGLQRGNAPYPTADPSFPRQQDPLDPNQLLLAPAWWASAFNLGLYPAFGADPFAAQGPMSGHAYAFMNYAHAIVDPNGATAPGAGGYSWWDRSGSLPKRAFFSKPLIVSAGPDSKLGIPLLGQNYAESPFDMSGAPAAAGITPANLILIEDAAAKVTPNRQADLFLTPIIDGGGPNDSLTAALIEWSLDDITNQTLQTTGGGFQ
jgi:prepilin-type N-terminal cleavage/methylation domain-containing protein